MENDRIRCRKCRNVLLSENNLCVLDAHGEEYHDTVGSESTDSKCNCPSVKEHSCLYLSEESFPDFILQAIEEMSWTKGKIYCPACQARLGSFNFVSGSQCACGSHVLPQVHILRSKVDWMKVGEALPHPVSFPNHSVALCASTLPLHDPGQISPSEASDLRENVALVGPRNFTDLPEAADTPSRANSSRPHNKKKMDVHEESHNKVKHRKQNRKKVPTNTTISSDESSEGLTAKSSCFEVLDNELIGTEESSNSEEEDERDIPDNLVCPVCLDILYSPLVTKPCGHIFCEPCLRRMAHPNPTSTHCPLCRQIIGQCMPCPELANDVRNGFFDLYGKRRQFELQHNSQHLPLPWTRNFRLRNTYNTSESWVERAGGWRTIMVEGTCVGQGLKALTLHASDQASWACMDLSPADAKVFKYLWHVFQTSDCNGGQTKEVLYTSVIYMLAPDQYRQADYPGYRLHSYPQPFQQYSYIPNSLYALHTTSPTWNKPSW